jgi:hypothetical protein
MQADAFPGFNRLYERGVTEVACWAHVRRKFHDLYETHQSPIAKEALERIGVLYGIEREIRGRPPDESGKPGTNESAQGQALLVMGRSGVQTSRLGTGRWIELSVRDSAPTCLR